MGTKHDELMLIDGDLVGSSSGKRFDNVNPATEEIIGQVADGTLDDVDRAIAAARTAFDTTDWATNGELRAHCLLQMQAALEGERELYRQELIDETGMPRKLTYVAQLDSVLEDVLRYPDQRPRPVRRGYAVRWVQAERAGPAERPRRFRAVPADEVARSSRRRSAVSAAAVLA